MTTGKENQKQTACLENVLHGASPELWNNACTDGGEGSEAVDVFLFGGPADGAEDEEAVEGVVEGPGVVAGDAADDAALVAFEGPELGAGQAILDGGADDVEAPGVAAHVPVGFVGEMEGAESLSNGMSGRGEHEVEFAMAKT